MKHGKEHAMDLLIKLCQERQVTNRAELAKSSIVYEVVSQVLYKAGDQGLPVEKRARALEKLIKSPVCYPYARIYAGETRLIFH
jgi:hypothetical protein